MKFKTLVYLCRFTSFFFMGFLPFVLLLLSLLEKISIVFLSLFGIFSLLFILFLIYLAIKINLGKLFIECPNCGSQSKVIQLDDNDKIDFRLSCTHCKIVEVNIYFFKKYRISISSK